MSKIDEIRKSIDEMEKSICLQRIQNEGRERGERLFGQNIRSDRADRNGVEKYKNTGGLMCSHCGEMGHSKQRCYEFIGYPEWWDFI